MSKSKASEEISVLMKQVDELLGKIGDIADEHNITVYLSGKNFYSGMSRYPVPKIVGCDEDGISIDADGEEVWESSTDGMWASSSDRC